MVYFLYITSINDNNPDNDNEWGFKSSNLDKLLKAIPVNPNLNWSLNNQPPNYEKDHKFWEDLDKNIKIVKN